MTRRRDSRFTTEERRRPVALLGVVAVIGGLSLGGLAFALAATVSVDPGAPTVQRIDPPSPAPAVRRTASPRPTHRVSQPARLMIPAIGVRAQIVRLGLNRDRTLQVPRDFADTGWWTGGSRPGERGPAVIAGHVDSRVGPAVFFRLASLRRGDAILVVRRDGSVARFAVQRLARYPKARFPTELVYGSTRRPTLRLITCSGDFDRSAGHYVDNTVVYAVAARAAVTENLQPGDPRK